MADIKVSGLAMQAAAYIAEHGNAWLEKYNVTSDSTGKVNSTAVAQNDVLLIGVLPAGAELFPHQAVMAISDAFTTSTTFAVGFQYVDGTDVTAFPQDADYFITATAADSTGVTRGNNAAARPNTLSKDAYLTVTVGGAANAAAGIADFTIGGRYKGTL